jgi:hypothetical protein
MVILFSSCSCFYPLMNKSCWNLQGPSHRFLTSRNSFNKSIFSFGLWPIKSSKPPCQLTVGGELDCHRMPMNSPLFWGKGASRQATSTRLIHAKPQVLGWSAHSAAPRTNNGPVHVFLGIWTVCCERRTNWFGLVVVFPLYTGCHSKLCNYFQ